jgi:hypothetical protein
VIDLNLEPTVGEEVRVDYRSGVFRVVKVHKPGEDHPNPNLRTPESQSGTVDLRREEDGFDLPAIPWSRLNFVDETRPVRRAIEGLKTNSDGPIYPNYVVDYEVKTGDDHEGNPAFFVRFLVDPNYFYRGGRISEERITELNLFLSEVQTTLLRLDLDRWSYVRASEARGALDVAS